MISMISSATLILSSLASESFYEISMRMLKNKKLKDRNKIKNPNPTKKLKPM